MSDVLRIQLSDLGPSCEVRVIESRAGELSHVAPRPFPALTVGLARALCEGERASAALTPDDCATLTAAGLMAEGRLIARDLLNRRIGRRLFDTLFPPGPSPNAVYEATLEAASAGGPIPLQLRFDEDAVDLAQLPWELICDPAGAHPVAAGQLLLTRYINFARKPPIAPAAGRLDILVVSPRPVDADGLPDAADAQAATAAFKDLAAQHRVTVTLCPPTFSGFTSALNTRPYDIVHFDGHGALDRGAAGNASAEDGEGYLVFEAERDRRMDFIPAAAVADNLSERGVRLFVANACESGAVAGATVFGSIGPRAIRAGVPAVVAMQALIPTELAGRFALEFYATLARGEPVAAAAVAGRKALRAQNEWHVPVIYLRSRDAQGSIYASSRWAYLPPLDDRDVRPRRAEPYKFVTPYEITDRPIFFGRKRETDALLAKTLGRPLTVLAGDAGVGKTSLVNAGLIPALLREGYLVVSVREYAAGDPVMALRAAAQAADLDTALPAQGDLCAMLIALAAATGRPVVAVFDAFEEFLLRADPARQADFFDALAEHYARPFSPRAAVLLVVRGDALVRLASHADRTSDLLGGLMTLEPLSRDAARLAVEGPLAYHEPPGRYETGTLNRLLKDLETVDEDRDGGEGRVNPALLQVVCDALYRAADGAEVITEQHYPKEGSKAILAERLRAVIADLGAGERPAARAALEALALGAGEPTYRTLDDIARAAGLPREEAQNALDRLLRAAVASSRPGADGALRYAISHRLLAEEVRGWLDPERAQDMAARATLARAWDDWREAADTPARPLLDAARLRAVRERKLALTPAQRILMLRSAVACRREIGHWAREVAADDAAKRLLAALHAATPTDEPVELRLAARAIGLSEVATGERGALARAALSDASGVTRHTATLALGAAGLDEELQGGPGWRRAQALGQMRAAGLRLHEMPFPFGPASRLWAAGIRAAEDGGRIATAAAAAYAGTGLAVMLALAVILLVAQMRAAAVTTLAFDSGLRASLVAFGAVVGMELFAAVFGSRASRYAGAALGAFLAAFTMLPYVQPDRWALFMAQIAITMPPLGVAIAAGSARARRRATFAVAFAVAGLAAALSALAWPLSSAFTFAPAWSAFDALPAAWRLPAEVATAFVVGGLAAATAALSGRAGSELWSRSRQT